MPNRLPLIPEALPIIPAQAVISPARRGQWHPPYSIFPKFGTPTAWLNGRYPGEKSQGAYAPLPGTQFPVVQQTGLEPAASCSRTRRAANCATAACVPLMPPEGGTAHFESATKQALSCAPGGSSTPRTRRLSVVSAHQVVPAPPGPVVFPWCQRSSPPPVVSPTVLTTGRMIPGISNPVEEATGIEPAFPGWEPGVLTDRRYLHHVGNGTEAVPCVSALCSPRRPGGYIGTRQAGAGRRGIAEPPAFLRATAPPQYRPFLSSGTPPDPPFPRTQERAAGRSQLCILHSAFCIHFKRPQPPPASTVCWRLRPIRCVYVPAAGGGCGRACAQGGARLM